MQKEQISVIIPIYNGEKYLKNCIDGLMVQTYSNLEIILINDGSTDQTENICKQYADQYPNILYLFQCNAGAAAARNKGIEHASGKYIAFVDCDDYITKDYFAQLLSLLQRSKAKIACCSYMKGNSETLKKFHRNEAFGKVKKFTKQEAVQSLFYRKEIMGYPVCKLIDKELLENLRFPTGIRLGEDFAFVYQLLQRCEYVAYTERQLYFYYQSETSITHSLKMEDMKTTWESIYAMQKEMEEKDLKDTKAIQSKLFILACDFLIRMTQDENDAVFKDQLEGYIRRTCKGVLFDRECKMSNRMLAAMCCLSRKATIFICSVVLQFLRITGIQLKRAV